MAISKITLNGVVQIDLTSDTVTAQTLVDDYVAHGNDGNTVTGELVLPTARTASDVTVSGATVTIPSGAYASQVQKSVANATYSAVVDNDFTTQSGQRKWVNTGWVDIESGGYIGNGVINVVDTTYNAVPANTTITPTTSAQTIGGTNYMMEGAVTVSAMPTGTAGTPTASKGAVNNHSIAVTPSVTNTTGYITGSTINGTAVTVSASELVSGDKSITQNGTNIDVADYSTVTVNVSGGGLDADYKAVVEGTASAPTFPSGLTAIKKYCFYQDTTLTAITMPNTVTSVGASAFQSCTSLASVVWSTSLSSMDSYAFSGCYALSGALTLPSTLTSIGGYAFQSCDGITSVSCSGAISSIGGGSFGGSANNPMQITSVSLPNMVSSTIGTVFGSATANVANQQLTFADLGSVGRLNANSFANCYKLQTMVLRKTGSICTLYNVSAFTNTPFSGYNSLTGTVYVPNSLISSYQQASQWSTLYNNGTVEFVKIEGSIYEI